MTSSPDAAQAAQPGTWARLAEGWRRFRADLAAQPMERVGFWFALLLVFVPIFALLLFFRRYSLWARLGWSAWLGLIVFVKVFGLADPVFQVDIPRQSAVVNPDAGDVPLKTFVGRLLGSQYMERYSEQGSEITLVYERHDGYFGSPDVVADLGISNGFSLLFRRDFQAVTFQFPQGAALREMRLTRQSYREFFGLDAAAMARFADPIHVKESPMYNVTPAEKLRFITAFLR